MRERDGRRPGRPAHRVAQAPRAAGGQESRTAGRDKKKVLQPARNKTLGFSHPALKEPRMQKLRRTIGTPPPPVIQYAMPARIDAATAARIQALRVAGNSVREIAAALGIGTGTVSRYAGRPEYRARMADNRASERERRDYLRRSARTTGQRRQAAETNAMAAAIRATYGTDRIPD